MWQKLRAQVIFISIVVFFVNFFLLRINVDKQLGNFLFICVYSRVSYYSKSNLNKKFVFKQI